METRNEGEEKSFEEIRMQIIDVYMVFSQINEAKRMPVMRKIQRIISQKFHLRVSRSSWRSRVDIMNWFCMNWPLIKDYVPNVIKMVTEQRNTIHSTGTDDIKVNQNKKNTNAWINEEMNVLKLHQEREIQTRGNKN